ncbi:hypothetical protein ScPMuIL_001936 [Solemya velum]
MPACKWMDILVVPMLLACFVEENITQIQGCFSCPTHGVLYKPLALCYWTTGATENVIDSHTICSYDGGSLAVFPNEDVWSYVTHAYNGSLGNESYWLGYTDEITEGLWTTFFDTNGTFVFWDVGEPNDGEQADCAMMGSCQSEAPYPYCMADYTCTTKNKAVCYKQVSLTTGCNRQYKVVEQDARLGSHIWMNTTRDTLIECAMFCLDHYHCKSFNFRSTDGTCELNNVRFMEVAETVMHFEGEFVYAELVQSMDPMNE